jgi:hypothetical protein
MSPGEATGGIVGYYHTHPAGSTPAGNETFSDGDIDIGRNNVANNTARHGFASYLVGSDGSFSMMTYIPTGRNYTITDLDSRNFFGR